ncbi:transcriptional regulator with XRE-family HTH domain [Nonlabens xylanidelens]|uniref:Transcriptional regulator with XRE-family HTH domain n=1 Tax=Nonlabens xylanidelens TaxID=191564 RepID=A0A2S6IRR7_9FLAO|nr:helix-turn-helix transcriptional regulator [Nonlabens xylanidelens]PPK96726.1 transcriptional regulator with XRE-family HTH domain [Nonlabens xylanidelens]PQJ13438.1 transcriptional regulator [Nonlabens xylanidelens]
MSFFGKNIKKIRGVKGLSQQAFADLFDLKRGTLGAYEEGRSEPKIDTIILIANYFSIAIGDMLTAELTVNQLLRFNDSLTLTPEELEREQFAQIPCITEKTAHDYIEYYDNDAFLADLPTLTLPLNTEKDFIGYTVTNLEMTTHDKGLFPKDVVIGEKVPKNVITKLNNGTVVLAVTDKTLILRRLYITDKGLVLRADHKNVDDITVDKKAVKQLWRVRYVFFRRMPDFSDSMEDKMAFLEAQMKELRDSI